MPWAVPRLGRDIEVWLSVAGDTGGSVGCVVHLPGSIICTDVRADESTDSLPVRSRSLRGAQREITGGLMVHGYRPEGPWRHEARDDEGAVVEVSRRFSAEQRDDP
jgi:hypothetical protein